MNDPRVPDSASLDIQVLEIRNKYTGEKVAYQSIEYKYTHNIYSAKKDQPIWCMFVDGEHISKHKPYLISYLCKTCQAKVQVGITQFLRKIQKDNQRCRYCVNQDESKRQAHSELLKDKPCTRHWKQPVIEAPPVLTPLEQRSLYEKTFYQELDSEEQQSYFSYHLTVDEYKHIQSRIVSMNHGRIAGEAFQRLDYFPIWKCSNQMKYSSRFYDPIQGTIEKPSQIQCQCDTCDRVFSIKHLHSLKNKYKVLCQECSLCRHTYKKRPLMNIQNEKVLVQSNLETKFVKWCNEHDIRVINGPKLKYEWKGSEHTYHVDFELPELKWIIETKDMHIWHQEQVSNGKWDAKKECALQQISNETYNRFITVFPKNWMRITQMILSKRTEKI